MQGIIFALLAGIFVSVQNSINPGLTKEIGAAETTVVVHFVGLISAIILNLIIGTGDIRRITEVDKIYLIGGALGVGVVYSVAQSVPLVGTTMVSILMLLSQLTIALIIDHYGLFGMEKNPIMINKVIGIAVIMAGIFIFNKVSIK